MAELSPTPHELSREDSRKIKRMGRGELTAYLKRVYMRGYEEGKLDRAPARQE